MLHDLDRTLEALLREFADPELIAQTSITFATPGTGFPPQGVALPAIDLFLYDVHENLEYRGRHGEWQQRPDGTRFRRPEPVHVDCHYLVTAWAPEGALVPDQDEHRLLGVAMAALLRFRELPASALRGALVDAERPVRAAAARAPGVRSLGELWTALGGRPRPSFEYVVTVSLAVGPLEEGGRPPDALSLSLTPRGSS